MNKNEFVNDLKELNIDLTSCQFEQLQTYYQLLVNWNQKMNLTAITAENDVYLKHFYDSLTLAKIVSFNNQKICDIGTGAGFPGLVLKIVFPLLQVTLLESLTKRCQFLKEVITTLNLEGVEIINDRAEIYSQKNREIFDIVTSRAVAKTSELLEYSVPLLKINGLCLTMKTQKESINESIYSTLNIKEEKSFHFFLPSTQPLERTITSYQKLAKTNPQYPREYSKIKRQPL